MQRVIAAAVVGVLALVGLAGCHYTPPPGYRPPVIDSVTIVSPQPAAPGDVVTFEVAVHDDEVISHAVARALVVPGGATLPGPRTCTATVVQVGSLKEAVITVSCPVPTFASDGTWSTELFIGDRPAHTSIETAIPGTERRLSFQVAGGSEDRSSPKLISYTTDPAVIGQETRFTVTMVVRDTTPPVTLPYGGVYQFFKPFSANSLFGCGEAQYTPVSATDTTITMSCNPGYFSPTSVVRTETGLHRAGMPVIDALGHQGTLEMFIDVQYEAPSPTP